MSGRLGTAALTLAISGGLIAAPAGATRREASSGTAIRVTTSADDVRVDGNCSLREALQAADTDRAVDACPAGHGADTVVLSASTYSVGRGPLSVRSAVTLVGAGRDQTFIDRGATTTADTTLVAIEVQAGAALTISGLTISGLTIEHANTAIRNTGRVDLANVALRHDNPGPNQYGAGVFNRGVAQLTNVVITDTPFALWNDTVHASLSADGLFLTRNGGQGGDDGASVVNNGSMRLHDALFDGDNQFCCSDGSIENGEHATLLLADSRITNDAPAANGGTEFGGFALDNAGDATIVDSSIDHDHIARALFNGGHLVITRTTISHIDTSHAIGGAEVGGIANGGTLVLSNSTIDHTGGATAGALVNVRSGVATLTNDTITGNVAQYPGPDADPHPGPPAGAIWNDGRLAARNLTITRNVVGSYPNSQAGSGGIVTTAHGATALADTILDDNVSNTPGASANCSGSIESLGFDLFGAIAGCALTGSRGGDLVGRPSGVGPLADNGGATHTELPSMTSAAVDHGNPAPPSNDPSTCLPRDQRGVARPRDGNADGLARCDIGAVER